VLRDLAYEYVVPIAATIGQVGGFLHTEVAQLLDGANRSVMYLGDLDHAGGQIEQNTRRVLVQAGSWRRVALTAEQVAEHNLPSVIKHDWRYKDGHEHEAWETEALSQRVIVGLVRDALDTLLSEPLADVQERERVQRDDLRRFLEGR
jgi:thioesterase domain-containing protein